MEGFETYVATYGEYLEDIRVRVYNIVIVFTCAFVGGFFLTTPLIKYMTSVLKINDASIVATSPFQLVDLAMDVGVFCAVVVTGPLLLYHLYRFLRPGLLARERRIFLWLLPVALLLFCIGFSYGFITMYYALGLIAAVNVSIGVVNLWDVSLFVSQMMLTSTLLGLLFEFPIVISFLIRAHIMSVDFLRAKRRHAIVAIFTFVALLPPTDGLSLVLMATPLVAIYELTILCNISSRRVVTQQTAT